MSQKELNQVNKVLRTVVMGVAVIIAIVALIYNPGHLFTAAVVYAFGAEAEFVRSEDADKFDLRY